MKVFSSRLLWLILGILSLSALSGCVPATLSPSVFPIPLGERWTVTLASPYSVSNTFYLRGKPDLDQDSVSYEGISGENLVYAIYLADEDVLSITIFLEKPKSGDAFGDTKGVFCALYRAGGRWLGNGMVGTWNEVKKTTYRKMPECSAQRAS